MPPFSSNGCFLRAGLGHTGPIHRRIVHNSISLVAILGGSDSIHRPPLIVVGIGRYHTNVVSVVDGPDRTTMLHTPAGVVVSLCPSNIGRWLISSSRRISTPSFPPFTSLIGLPSQSSAGQAKPHLHCGKGNILLGEWIRREDGTK